MYPDLYPMMQPPCWYCMMHTMPIMSCPMIMPEYESEEKMKKKCKREDIEFDEYAERGVEKKPCPPTKPIEVPIQIPTPAPAPVPKPVPPIAHIEAEQEITNIVNVVEVEAPDVINKLIALGLTLEAARQLIKTIVKITKKCNN